MRRVFLTSEGQVRLAELEKVAAKHEDIVTEGLTAPEKAQLLTLLEKLGANLRALHEAGE